MKYLYVTLFLIAVILAFIIIGFIMMTTVPVVIVIGCP